MVWYGDDDVARLLHTHTTRDPHIFWQQTVDVVVITLAFRLAQFPFAFACARRAQNPECNADDICVCARESGTHRA